MIKLFNKKQEKKQIDNTIIISDKRGVYTAYQEHGDTLPMVCRNNGREYYILKHQGDQESQFEIPDECIYYDPHEYGNVLTMGAHKQLFERRRTLFQNLAPWALVVAMIIVAILLIIAGD